MNDELQSIILTLSRFMVEFEKIREGKHMTFRSVIQNLELSRLWKFYLDWNAGKRIEIMTMDGDVRSYDLKISKFAFGKNELYGFFWVLEFNVYDHLHASMLLERKAVKVYSTDENKHFKNLRAKLEEYFTFEE